MTDKEKFANIKAVFLDMDGTIYHGGTLYPTTMPFIRFLESRGIPYAYCSNNTSYSKSEYVARLQKFGLNATEKNFYTATDFLVDTLKKEYPQWKRLYLLGMPAMAGELRSHGYEIVDAAPEAVIVSFDKLLCYERLCQAAYFVRENVPGFSTHPDVFCPSDQPTCLVDCGAISRCVELASGKTLRQLGKPDAGFLRSAAARLGLAASQTLMIGDRLATDIAAGTNAGTFTCRITGPGADLASFAPVTPDWSCNDLGELQKLWENCDNA
ncbi:MAG: HAD-IIA family hydrolase [Lentisphaeria bacterium]|nr:HAD-IIA family hydrolase [Lentisphaeria bacterium]